LVTFVCEFIFHHEIEYLEFFEERSFSIEIEMSIQVLEDMYITQQ